MRARAALGLVGLLPLAACNAESRGAGGSPGGPVTEVFDSGGASLGSVVFPVSCSEPAAQDMRLGLALLHNMTYEMAERAFAAAADRDPDCVLAYWGMAMTYFHPLWPDVPSDDAGERGWDLLQEARSRGPQTAREGAYIAALEAYYVDGPSRDERSRLRELLDDMLFALGQYEEAQVAYELALDRSPNRSNSLYGAGRSAELSRDTAAARGFYGTLLENVGEGSQRSRLEHAVRLLEAG